MRALPPPLLALLAACALGCDAAGSVQGGQAVLPDPCEATKGGHTWTDLYTCYFGPTGKASCSALSGCHVSPNTTAASISGFVCGPTKDDCWFGMTRPIYVLQGVEPPVACDAGAAGLDGSCPIPPDAGPDADLDAAPICSCFPSASNPYLPIVPTGGTADPTAAYIWDALHVPSSTCTKALCDNMPCGNLGAACPKHSGGYVFTADDMARISAWIKEGAQNN